MKSKWVFLLKFFNSLWLILISDKIPGEKIFEAYLGWEFDEIFPGGKFFWKGLLNFSKGFLGLVVWYLTIGVVFDYISLV